MLDIPGHIDHLASLRTAMNFATSARFENVQSWSVVVPRVCRAGATVLPACLVYLADPGRRRSIPVFDLHWMTRYCAELLRMTWP